MILFEITKEILTPILKNRPEIAKKLSKIVASRQLELAQLRFLHPTQIATSSLTSQQILKGIKSFFGI